MASNYQHRLDVVEERLGMTWVPCGQLIIVTKVENRGAKIAEADAKIAGMQGAPIGRLIIDEN